MTQAKVRQNVSCMLDRLINMATREKRKRKEKREEEWKEVRERSERETRDREEGRREESPYLSYAYPCLFF